MSNKKKIILFLGAVSLIVFGNYKQFTKNKVQTTVEGKTSEKATSSVNETLKERKGSERATSSAGGNTGTGNNANQNAKNPETAKEVKSSSQPTPVVHTRNTPAVNTAQNSVTQSKNNKTDTNPKKNEKNGSPKTQNPKTAQQQNNINLKDGKDIKNQFKLDNTKSEAPKTTTETKSSEKATSSSGN